MTITGGNDIDFSVNNDVVIGSTRDDSSSFSSVETYGNLDSFPISGSSGENILNSIATAVDFNITGPIIA